MDAEEKSAYAKITGKMRRFVDAYIGVSNCNATDAARRAGYGSPHPEGSRLLRNATVRAAIDERMNELAMPASEVLSRLTTIARNPLGMLIERVNERPEEELIRRFADGEDDDPEERRIGGYLPGEWGLDLEAAKEAGLLHLIHEFSYDRQGRPRIRFSDPLRALELLGKRHGLFVERVEHSGNIELSGAAEAFDRRLASLVAASGEGGAPPVGADGLEGEPEL